MQKAHLETQEAAEMVSLDLKSLEARKVEIGDAIDASDNASENLAICQFRRDKLDVTD